VERDVSVVGGRLPVVLEGLSDVAWAELEHAYGSAADVAELIRALRATHRGGDWGIGN
jgi:hypothetical protein